VPGTEGRGQSAKYCAHSKRSIATEVAAGINIATLLNPRQYCYIIKYNSYVCYSGPNREHTSVIKSTSILLHNKV
jgi:hypothetical protein